MPRKKKQSTRRSSRRFLRGRWTVRKSVYSGLFLLAAGVVFFLFFLNYPTRDTQGEVEFGVTFSPEYQESFGIDWKEAYAAILDDLGVRRFRLSAYWDVVEPEDDVFVFDDIDYQLDEAAKRDAKVIFAVGRKLPRWPECHDPEWISGYEEEQIEEELLEYLNKVVLRYRDHPAIERWQVENELFFPFGECENKLGMSSLRKEIDLVHSLSDKPVVVTDSGEWSAWLPAAAFGDVLGVSMYRESWNDIIGRVNFPIGPGFYQAKSDLIQPYQKKIIVTELQAEPWGARPVQEMTLQEMFESIDVEKFERNVYFAERVGFPEVYLWGVEWWYWLYQTGDERFWDAGKHVFGSDNEGFSF